MLCYKDTTFCASDCERTECPHHTRYMPKVMTQEQFRRISRKDMSDDCPDYTPPPMVA